MKALASLAVLAAAAVAVAGLQPGAHTPPPDAGAGCSAEPPPGHRFAPGFAEDFNGTSLDSKRWGHLFADPDSADRTVVKRTLPANAERQVYFDRDYLGLGIDPFVVHDGMATIIANPLSPPARAAVQAELDRLPGHRDNPVLRQLAYSSGLLSTRGLYTQRYGYFAARVRYTGGRGIWPAFWLLREDSHWPPEIDIVEALGHDPRTIYSSTHSSAAPRDTTRRIPFAGDPAEFHCYGALWLPDRIEYYVDGTMTASIATSPDMDRPMYLLLNLAIGGRWPGDPDAGTSFPARMDVDWVRTWQLAD